MKKAFTIIELLVAIGLLAGLLAASGIIFKSAIDAQRTATATAEITRKLRTITDQLTEDFEHLLKDSLIFLVWVPHPVRDQYGVPIDENGDGIYDEYENFDRVLFLTTGNFHTYHQRYGDIRGYEARICYMLAKSGYELASPEAPSIERDRRILARSQHILTNTAPLSPQDFPNFGSIPLLDFVNGPENRQYMYMNCNYEHDWATPADWNNADPAELREMLSLNTNVFFGGPLVDPTRGGLVVNTEDPNSIHMLLSEGVGEFKVQGWYESQQRWVPEHNPDGDDDYNDDSDYQIASDGINMDYESLPGILYPERLYEFGPVSSVRNYPLAEVDQAHFNDIPGLGRALKFTFTLYDSRGIFPEGRTFTHIVYLDN